MTDNKDNINNSPAGNVYDKIIAFLHGVYVDMKANIVVLLACVIFFTGALIFSNIKKGNTYTSSFTVVYEELVRKIYGDRIKKLNILLNNNKARAQALLGLDKKTMADIEEISATNILGEDLTKDLNTDKIPFIVYITINDTSNVTKIQNAILFYLETGNSYLNDKRKLKLAELKNELLFLDNQLNMMDTLKRKYYGIANSSESSNMSEANVYQISYELYKKKQELLKKIEMPQNLYVIDDALIPTKNNRSYVLITLAGVMAGFIAYLFIVYILLPVIKYKPKP